MTIPKHQRAEVLRDLEEKCWALRIAGWDFRSIGRELGISHASAQRHCKRVLEQLTKENAATADQWRQKELHRLDALLKGIWDAAIEGDQQLIDRCLKIQERRAKLLGLDSPVKIETTGKDGGPIEMQSIPDVELDRKIRLLLELVGQAGGETGTGGTVGRESPAPDAGEIRVEPQ